MRNPGGEFSAASAPDLFFVKKIKLIYISERFFQTLERKDALFFPIFPGCSGMVNEKTLFRIIFQISAENKQRKNSVTNIKF